MTTSPDSLDGVLSRIAALARDQTRVTLREVLEATGRRSFGPLLVVAGLVILTPLIGDIPGVPTLVGALVLVVAVQIAVGRRHIWLPEFILERSVAGHRLTGPVRLLRRPAGVIDRLLQPRLKVLLGDLAVRVIAVVCLLVAVVMPVMELVPFSANAAGVVLLAFGLALIVRDGLVVLIGMLATALVAWVIVSTLG